MLRNRAYAVIVKSTVALSQRRHFWFPKKIYRCSWLSTTSTTTTTTTTTQPQTTTKTTTNHTTPQRPFRILGLQQVAIGSTDRKALHELWVNVLGIDPTHTNIRIDSENVIEDILRVGLEPFAVEIDLMTPIDAEKSPKVHIPPLNHIGLWVDNLESAVTWMVQAGVRFTPGGIRVGAAGHPVAFIHPKASEECKISGNGVLIELVQAPECVIQAHHTKLSQQQEQ